MGLLKAMDEAVEHQIRVMTPEDGDYRVNWDPEDADSVEMAKEAFKKAKAKGLVAYKVNKKGDKSEIVQTFDAEANAYIFAPAPAGG